MKLRIGIVGPCSSGKSTLATGLKLHGYEARSISQEHSFVPAMWQRITNPDVLIFLDVSYEVAQKRRWLNWSSKDYAEQLRRLSHAQQHAHLLIDTDPLTVLDVLQQALVFLETIEKSGN